MVKWTYARKSCCSGDQDSILPLTGTRVLVNALAKELGLNTTVPYGVWFEGRQVRSWNTVSWSQSMYLDYELEICRLVGGHKSTETIYRLQRYEELRTRPHFLSQRDHSFCSVHLSKESLCLEATEYWKGRSRWARWTDFSEPSREEMWMGNEFAF